MNEKMKAAVFYECGGPEKIQLAEVPRPEAGHGQVLVQVKACALNHMDLWLLGGPADESYKIPFWGGGDIAGVVAGSGPEVAGFRPGERVLVNPGLFCGRCEHCRAGEESLCLDFEILGADRPGGLAEYVAVEAGSLVRLPDFLSFEEAAAVPLVFQTAWRALITQARLRPGEDVLILGASGGVATAAIQVAKLAGARVLAVTSSADKMARAGQLGADVVFNRRQGDYWAGIDELTGGRGVDVVVENVGSATWRQSMLGLVKGGRLVTYGRTTGDIGETDIALLFWNQLHLVGSTMANRREFAEVMKLIFQRKLRPVVDSVFPLAETRAAYERLLSGEQFGKVVVRV